MDLVKLVSDLCGIIDAQNEIIEAQAEELAQHCTVTRAENISALRRKYAETMGAPVSNTGEV